MLILENLQELQQTFEKAKTFAEQEPDFLIVITHLETHPSKFKSIAYEATAMVFALQDIGDNNNNNLPKWTLLLKKYGQNHAIQIHVGLGWALAQQHLDAIPFLNDLEPLLRWRVLDGYGYYDGFFRRRKVLQGILPDFLTTEEAKTVYYQGIGRSLWYTSKGNVEDISKKIMQLPAIQQIHLWRGVGIASCYASGIPPSFWQQFGEPISSFQAQLAAGAAMAVKSRLRAKSIDKKDPLNSCWHRKMTLDSIFKSIEKILFSEQFDDKMVYFEWIRSLDNFFVAK